MHFWHKSSRLQAKERIYMHQIYKTSLLSYPFELRLLWTFSFLNFFCMCPAFEFSMPFNIFLQIIVAKLHSRHCLICSSNYCAMEKFNAIFYALQGPKINDIKSMERMKIAKTLLSSQSIEHCVMKSWRHSSVAVLFFGVQARREISRIANTMFAE